MMRKKSENPKAKMKLLDAAQQLMLERGYAATSVEDICRAAKLTKGSFFHYFKSKEELGKAVLERFCGCIHEQIRQCCCGCGQGGDPLKRVYRHVEFAVEVSRDPATQGCLLGKLAQELSQTHPEIRTMCEDGFGQWAKLFKEDLDAARAKYVPRKKVDTQSLAEHFIAVCEGSQILAKVKGDRKVMERSLNHFKQYLESVFHAAKSK